MKQYLIYAVVFTALSFIAGGNIGIAIALLGGLFSTTKALRDLKAEFSNHVDTAEVCAEKEIQIGRYEAMITRIQKESKEKDELIKSYKNKNEELNSIIGLNEAVQEMNKAEVVKPKTVAKKTTKTTTKKTK